MSRSMHPPATLSKEQKRTIADVRRDIWTNSFYGMGYGALTGVTGHVLASVLTKRGYLTKLKLNRNTAMLSFLGGAALGSFLAASTTGKNQVHNLHPIFEVGAVAPGTPYQKAVMSASNAGRTADAEDRQRNRTLRRKTLSDSLPNKSDSHGGRWAVDKNDGGSRRDNRMLRRKTLQAKLANANGGFNDAHGGKWANDSGANDAHIPGE